MLPFHSQGCSRLNDRIYGHQFFGAFGGGLLEALPMTDMYPLPSPQQAGAELRKSQDIVYGPLLTSRGAQTSGIHLERGSKFGRAA